MTRSVRLTDFVLSALALSLVALWFWLERPSNTLSEDPFHPFLEMDSRPPESLTVSLAPARTVVRRNPDANSDTRFLPEQADAPPLDPARVDRLLAQLQSLEVLREVPSPKSLADYGITPQSLTVTIATGRSTMELALGRASRGSEGGYYAALRTRESTRTVVLAPSTEPLLEVTPEGLIDHRVTNLVPSEIARLTLTCEKTSLTVEQADSGRYFYPSGGVERYADRATIDSLLLSTTQLTVERYLPRDDRATPIEYGDCSIRLENVAADRTLTLSWSSVPKPCPGLPSTFMMSLAEARKPHRIGCVSWDFLKERPSTVPSLDDTHLFFLRYDEVEELTAKRPSQALTLERQGSSFRLVLPEAREISLNAGNGWLKSLTAASGRPLGRCDPKRKPYDFELTLRSGLVGRTGPMRDTVTLGPIDSRGTRPACRGDGTLLEIAASGARIFDLDPSQLAPLELLHEAHLRITEIRIRNEDGDQRLLPDVAGHLKLVVPKSPGDAARIESLAEQLGQLTAERWVHRAEYPRQLSAPPTAVLRWTVSPAEPQTESDAAPLSDARLSQDSSAAQTHELALFDDGRGGAIALLDRLETPFVLDARTKDFTRGLLVARGSFRLTESDDIATLSRGKDPIRCERSPAGFTCTALDEHGRPSESRSLTLLETLQTLDAQRVTKLATSRPAPQVILSVGKRGHPPRYTLTLWQPSERAKDGVWLGRAEKLPYLFEFESSKVQRLLDALVGAPDGKAN